MKSLKNTFTKLFATIAIIALVAACASVPGTTTTDLADQPVVENTTPELPADTGFSNGEDADPIVERPW